MGCERWVEAISAMADGEDPGVDPRLVGAHLRRCESCRDFQAGVTGRRVAGLVAAHDRSAHPPAVRWLLGACAVQIAVLAVPALVWGTGVGASVHGARHLGAFSLAYAIGLLAVVARPARARTMLAVGAFLAAALFVSGVADVASGSTGASGEAVHLPELLSVALLWLLVRGPMGFAERGVTA